MDIQGVIDQKALVKVELAHHGDHLAHVVVEMAVLGHFSLGGDELLEVFKLISQGKHFSSKCFAGLFDVFRSSCNLFVGDLVPVVEAVEATSELFRHI